MTKPTIIITSWQRFYENVMERIGCTQVEAEKVLALYRKYRLTKLDPIGGTISLKHGDLWNADVLRRALTQCNTGSQK